eukprot:UN26789
MVCAKKKKCFDIEVPCPAPEAGEQSESFQEYQKYQIESANRNNDIEVADTDTTDYDVEDGSDSQETIERLVWEIDIASNIYLAYTIFMIWVTAPFIVYQSSIGTKFKKGFLVLNQVEFILLALLVWYTYEYVYLRFAHVDIQGYWADMQTDACYADPGFLSDKYAIITDTCTQIQVAEKNFTQSSYHVEDTDMSVTSYEACYATTAGFGNDMNTYESSPQKSTAESLAAATFKGACNETELSANLAHSNDADYDDNVGACDTNDVNWNYLDVEYFENGDDSLTSC